MKRVFLVDMENLSNHVMDYANTLTVEDTVILFHNALLRDTLPEQYKETIKKYAGKVIVENITCKGKNAMDMQICTYMGYYFGKENTGGTQFYIVSKDKGYENAIKIAIKLLLRECETASIQRVDGFLTISKDTEIRENLKKILSGHCRKVVTVTTTAFTTTKTLRDYHIYLQKNISKSADEVFHLTKEYFKETYPAQTIE